MAPSCSSCRKKKKEISDCQDCFFQVKLKVNSDLQSTDPKIQKRGLRNYPPTAEEFLNFVFESVHTKFFDFELACVTVI